MEKVRGAQVLTGCVWSGPLVRVEAKHPLDETHAMRDHAYLMNVWELNWCGSLREVWNGQKLFFKHGRQLYKKQEFSEVNGKIVFHVRSCGTKRSTWVRAVVEARKRLKINGGVIKKGTELYILAKEIQRDIIDAEDNEQGDIDD